MKEVVYKREHWGFLLGFIIISIFLYIIELYILILLTLILLSIAEHFNRPTKRLYYKKDLKEVKGE